MTRNLSVLFVVCLSTIGSPGAAQAPLRVVAGWGVDTTGVVAWSEQSRAGDVRAIFRRWAAYLRSNARAQAPSDLWSAEEQGRWPAYDLTASIAYQGSSATVLDIRPVARGEDDEYVVKTLFATAGDTERDLKPIALTRVYATREEGGWVFSNGISRLTREWRRERVGPITYVIEPGYPFDRGRAESAVRFVDSLAAAFDLPQIEELTYYVATSPDQVHRLIGIDWTVGGVGAGYASYANRLILTGDPAFGEEYRHELAHFVFGPVQAEGRTHPMISEGVATWLGGSMGRDLPTLLAEYAAFLRARPEITLDSVLASAGADLGTRPAGAVLAQMIFERGGVAAVRELMTSGRGTDDLRTALTRILGIGWDEVRESWRSRALELGGRPGG